MRKHGCEQERQDAGSEHQGHPAAGSTKRAQSRAGCWGAGDYQVFSGFEHLEAEQARLKLLHSQEFLEARRSHRLRIHTHATSPARHPTASPGASRADLRMRGRPASAAGAAPLRELDWDAELLEWPALEWPEEPIRPATPALRHLVRIRILAVIGALAIACFLYWIFAPFPPR
jgi:hypothetical protein